MYRSVKLSSMHISRTRPSVVRARGYCLSYHVVYFVTPCRGSCRQSSPSPTGIPVDRRIRVPDFQDRHGYLYRFGGEPALHCIALPCMHRLGEPCGWVGLGWVTDNGATV